MQTKTHSVIESLTNVAIGYFINLGVQIVVFPMFNMHVPLSSNVKIGAVFTGISITRSYVLRRWFNRRTK